jgi:coenzyme F420-reducing hydrogenase beta subunit
MNNAIYSGVCTGCGDFSAELADISCSGVGLDGWTYTVIKTNAGANLFHGAVKRNLLKIEPSENLQTLTKPLVKLLRVKRNLINSYPILIPQDYKRVKNI